MFYKLVIFLFNVHWWSSKNPTDVLSLDALDLHKCFSRETGLFPFTGNCHLKQGVSSFMLHRRIISKKAVIGSEMCFGHLNHFAPRGLWVEIRAAWFIVRVFSFTVNLLLLPYFHSLHQFEEFMLLFTLRATQHIRGKMTRESAPKM